MSRVRSGNTKPEKFVRSLLHKQGFRFRLRRKDLPGKPDIVLLKYRTVIFIDGCFWHQHPGCKKATIPKQNSEFWEIKLKGNIEQDSNNQAKLAQLGWQVITLWECQIKSEKADILLRLEPLITQKVTRQQ